MSTRFRSSTARNHTKSVVDGVVTGESSQQVSKSWTDSFNGSALPGWKSFIARHMSATTVANGSYRNFKYGDGIAKVSNKTFRKSDGKLVSQSTVLSEGPALLPGVLLSGVSDPSGVATSAAVTAAKTQMLGKIRETYRQFQGGVFLGELAETLHMIKHPAAALRRGIDGYARSVMKHRARSLPVRTKNRIIRDTWLEYVFGWKPLINDIRDAAKALAYKDYRVFVPVSGHGRSVSATTFSDTTSSNTIGIKRTWTSRSTASCWLKGECGSSSAATSVASLDRFGFGSWTEVLPTVWELIPYSFLVDYFTNVGDIVDSFSTQLGSVLWINGTVRQETELVLTSFDTDHAYNASTFGSTDATYRRLITEEIGSYSGYVNRAVRFSRAPWVASDLRLDLYDFRFRVPGLGSTRWLNIAALLRLGR